MNKREKLETIVVGNLPISSDKPAQITHVPNNSSF
jgi:hypothetical protein